MKAVGYQKCLPIDQADALIDLDIPAPAAPSGRDMLVEIHAVSVNPVDTKVRQRDNPGEAPRILGFDGAGFVFGEQLYGAAGAHWKWDHKTVFSILSWLTFGALLVGRHQFGWRGRRAVRVLYIGSAFLLLAYAGSRFVLEVVLGRNL
jgi:hypothetical protein